MPSIAFLEPDVADADAADAADADAAVPGHTGVQGVRGCTSSAHVWSWHQGDDSEGRH